MSDLTHPLNEMQLPTAGASEALLSRCRALGLVGVWHATGECTDPELAEVLTAPDWCKKVDAALGSGSVAQVAPGIAVLRIRAEYRSYEPVVIDAYAFDDPAAVDWLASPIPRPDTPAVSLDTLKTLEQPMVWCAADTLATAEASIDIGDLADQLADAYETLDLLYTLGRSMTNLGKPEQFIKQACDSLRATLNFGYIAVHVPESSNVGDELSGKTIWSGTPGGDELRGTLDRLASAMARLGGVSDAFRGPQALVRPLNSDRGLAGIVLAGDKKREGGNVSSYDTKLIDAAGGFLSTFLTNSRLYTEQHKLAMGVLEALSSAIDAKDPYTRGHSQRVAWLSQHIGLALGFDEETAERLRIAGLMHDVGKIGVPEAVLQKPGKLTDDEFDEIKKHPAIGHRILRDLTGVDDILPAVLHHHERIDGRGYPHGLTDEQIPLYAKIVACADTFDAMSSTRSYRQKMPRDIVLAELDRSAGSQLDRGVVDAFKKIDLAGFDRLLRAASSSLPDADAA